MKKYLSIGLVTLFVLIGFGISANQAKATAPTPFFSKTTGNWSSISTWSNASCGGAIAATVPTTGNTVTICNGHTVTVDVSTAVVGATTIASGGTLVNTSGTHNLSNTLTVSNGGTLTLNGGIISMASDALVVTGNFNFSSGVANVNDFNGSGTTTMSGGTLKIGHDYDPTPTKFIATGGTVEFTGASAYNNPFTTLSGATYQFWNVLIDNGAIPGFKKHTAVIVISNNLTIATGGKADFTGNLNTANALYFDAAAQAEGTWGSTGSTADNTNNTFFLLGASGLVTVGTGSGSGGHARPRHPDTEAPVVTILGDSIVTINVGSTYIDAGATADDNLNGNVTSLIVTTSDVNTSVPGTYYVAYSVTDTAGNTTVAIRTVVVIDPNAVITTPPSGVDVAGQAQQVITNVFTNISNAYKFLVNMRLGSRHHDVIELQNRLRAEGFLTLPKSTGYFGPQTKKAVIKYQEAHNFDILSPLDLEKGTGFVGPYTRGMLNK